MKNAKITELCCELYMIASTNLYINGKLTESESHSDTIGRIIFIWGILKILLKIKNFEVMDNPPTFTTRCNQKHMALNKMCDNRFEYDSRTSRLQRHFLCPLSERYFRAEEN